MRESFETWIAEVLYCVRFLPDRKAIRQELEAHYEDHVRDLERLGYDHQLARKRALGTMGDPVEVGQALDRVHKPWLGWLWLASKGILMLSCFLLLWTLPRITLDSLTPVQRVGDYEPEGFFYFSGDAPERTESVRTARGHGASTVKRAGYTISIPYAAAWKYSTVSDSTGEPYDQYWLTIVVAADDQRFWDRGPIGMWQELRTLDDAGRICDTVWDPEGGNFVRARSFHDPFRSLSYYYISQLEPPGDWLEITYPYGEPWSIRVDWEEVQP